MIIKLQRPMSCNDPEHERDILGYNEDRSEEFTMKMTSRQIDALFGDEYRIFVDADLTRKSGGAINLAIRGQVEDPGWKMPFRISFCQKT